MRRNARWLLRPTRAETVSSLRQPISHSGLFLFIGLGRRSGLAHDKRCTGLLGQLARLLRSAQQRLRGFLQVGVFRVGDRCFHDGQLSSSKTGGAPELSYSCQLSTSSL